MDVDAFYGPLKAARLPPSSVMDLRESSKDNGIADEDSERLPEMSESFTHHITHHLTSYDVA
jgi:hypothetical protein